MYRVEYRFEGQGLWSRFAVAPLQSAVGQQRALQAGKFADEARIVQSSSGQRFDQRV
jgi:hypothetical protein